MTVDRTDFRLSRQAIQKAEAAVVAAAIAQYRSKASSYTKQFGYSLYEIREVTVTAPEPPRSSAPMMGVQATAAASPAERFRVEPGQVVVELLCNGIVQLK